MVSGQPLHAIASQLSLHRRTLWRWSKLPAFQAELSRLHALLTIPAPAPSPSSRITRHASSPPPSTPRTLLHELPENADAMVDEILRRCHAAGYPPSHKPR